MNNAVALPNGDSTLRLATHANLTVLNDLAHNQKCEEAMPQPSDAALLDAVREGDADEVRALLEAGADANLRDAEGWTVLMLVTVKGHLEAARELLNAGADVDTKNEKGWTALRFAVSMDDTEALRLLLDAGANVNEPDAEGDTALMQATREKSTESLDLLLAYGADVNVRNSSGETALEIAARYGYHEVILKLKEAGADGWDGSQAAAEELFSEDELLNLMEKIEGIAPVVPAPDKSAEQSLVSISPVPGVLERLAAALEALRSSAKTVAPVSVADIAHKLTLSLPEAAALSGLSRTHLRKAMKAGNLEARKLGQGWRIKRAELEAYVSKL